MRPDDSKITEYEVFVTREFKRAFKPLARKDKELREAVSKVVEKLKKDPKSGKPLSYDLAGKWSVRVGRVYRIIYEIDEENKRIILLTIGHRKKVY